MKKIMLLGFAVSTLALGAVLPASAAPLAPSAAIAHGGGDLVQVRGHGWGHMHRGGRGHHYGWHRGRGHHYGWSRGRHHHHR